jgi:hypothetical protein
LADHPQWDDWSEDERQKALWDWVKDHVNAWYEEPAGDG